MWTLLIVLTNELKIFLCKMNMLNPQLPHSCIMKKFLENEAKSINMHRFMKKNVKNWMKGRFLTFPIISLLSWSHTFKVYIVQFYSKFLTFQCVKNALWGLETIMSITQAHIVFCSFVLGLFFCARAHVLVSHGYLQCAINV